MSMFSHDTDLAYFMLSSGLLNQACNAICDMRVSVDDQDSPFTVTFDVFETPDYKILVFRSSLECTSEYLEEKGEEVTPLNTKFFNFANQKVNPAISINKTAADAFDSLFEENDVFIVWLQIITTKPLLVTGNALGGSVASLFTLYLLENVYKTTSEQPICITFGSPLLGNDGLRKAIYQQASWPPCFIHVALSQDPIPKLFSSPNYDPFGLFLFCSASGCASIGQVESVKEIMVALKHVENLDLSGIQIDRYRQELVKLKNKGMPHLSGLNTESLELGIALDLQAIGVLQAEEVNNDTRSLIIMMKTRKAKGIKDKRNETDKKKQLNKVKISMAYHEWYKKRTVVDGGYYDAYKYPNGKEKNRSRNKIKTEKAELDVYWEKKVKEANQTPQKLRTAWLFASPVYRRMCEPLHIADHYLSGKTDYIDTARPQYLKLLEGWFDDEQKNKSQTNPIPPQGRRKAAASLTEDSCFWAHVEEAVISLDVLKNIETSNEEKNSAAIKLKGFEDYVMSLIADYSISPEIFLPKSTFMEWWVEYKRHKDGILGESSYSSPLADFMMNKLQSYA